MDSPQVLSRWADTYLHPARSAAATARRRKNPAEWIRLEAERREQIDGFVHDFATDNRALPQDPEAAFLFYSRMRAVALLARCLSSAGSAGEPSDAAPRAETQRVLLLGFWHGFALYQWQAELQGRADSWW